MLADGSQAAISQTGKGNRLGRGSDRACDTYLGFQKYTVRVLSYRDTADMSCPHLEWEVSLSVDELSFCCRIATCIKLFPCSVHLHGLGV